MPWPAALKGHLVTVDLASRPHSQYFRKSQSSSGLQLHGKNSSCKMETVLNVMSSDATQQRKPYSDHPGFSWRELSFSLQLCFLAHFNSSTVTTLVSFQTELVWAAAENPGYHLPREFNSLCVCVSLSPLSMSLSHTCTHRHTHPCSANLASYLTQNWLERYWNTHVYSEQYSLLK